MNNEDRLKIVNGFLELMEQGVAPWTKGWKAGTSGAARSAVSNKKYRGGNIVLCWVAMMLRGYSTSRWITWKQVKDAGGKVREGEAKKYLWLYRPYTYTKKDPNTKQPLLNAKGEPEKGIGFTAFHTYNVDQCEGLPEALILGNAPPPLPVPADFEYAPADLMMQDYVQRSGVGFGIQGDRAFYSPGADRIIVPPKSAYMARVEEKVAAGVEREVAFQDAVAEFYGTLFHEAVHSTGHKSRLDRGLDKGKGFFGSEEYAFEELVAELGASFVMAEHGLPGHCQHVEYLASWAKGMRDKPEAFFKAAALASTAADLITNEKAVEQGEESPAEEPQALAAAA